MNVRMMRAVDRYCGVPLCWLAGLTLAVRGRKRVPAPIEEWRTVLVMKFFGMGSILLSTPFLDALRSASPKARIVFLTFDSAREMTDRLPQIDETISISTMSFREFVRDAITAVLRVRRMRVAAVFDLEFFSKFSTLMAVLSGAAVRSGFALPTLWRSRTLTHTALMDRTAHVTSVFLRQLSAFGVHPSAGQYPSALEPSEKEIQEMQGQLGLTDPAIEAWCVNINAGATSPERGWPPERFMEVVAAILEEDGDRRIFLTGGADDRSFVQGVLDNHPALRGQAVNCAGRLDLGGFIALLRRSAMMLTNDSGPMHIAAAVGTPVVALFGPESPALYGPLGFSRVLYRGLPCSPCLSVYNAKAFRCPFDARCMKEVSVGEVLSAVRQLKADTVAKIA